MLFRSSIEALSPAHRRMTGHPGGSPAGGNRCGKVPRRTKQGMTKKSMADIINQNGSGVEVHLTTSNRTMRLESIGAFLYELTFVRSLPHNRTSENMRRIKSKQESTMYSSYTVLAVLGTCDITDSI